MILGGHKGTKDIKSFYRVEMVRKTHRRKTHRRKTHRSKTSRRVHRRRTHRRGGAANQCAEIRDRLANMEANLNQQSANTIEDFVGEVRVLYDEAKRKGCPQNLLNQIEDFENGPVSVRTNQLLRINNNVNM